MLHRCFAVLFFFSLLSGSALSEEPAGTQPPQSQTSSSSAQTRNTVGHYSDRERRKRHFGEVYFEVSNIYYDEPNFARNKGFMYGVSGDYTYRPNHFMLKLDGRFSLGNVDYWSSNYTANGIRDYNLETRFSVGYTLKAGSRKARFTPFFGLGHRYLFDGFSAISPGGYDRKSNYLYSPAGMETMFRLGHRLSLGLTGEYDLFWHGWQYTELQQEGLSVVPVKNDQTDGWGARGSLAITRRLGRIDFTIAPFFRYWDIKQSDLGFQIISIYSQGYLYYFGFPGVEPRNTTTEWGSKFGIAF